MEGSYEAPLDRWSILLAHHDPFVTRYLERALSNAGAATVDRYESENALAGIGDWSPFSACLVSVRYQAAAERGLGACGAPAPALFILGDGSATPSGRAFGTFTYPFACYQVVDALVRLGPAAMPVEDRVRVSA